MFKEIERKWERYHELEAKLKERIQSTVAPQKKATLRTIYSVRQWLTTLKDTTALAIETIRLNIQLEYKKHVSNTHLDWPSSGPTIWLAKWEELLNRAERYEENLPTWFKDVCLVWEQVPDLAAFFSNVKQGIWKGTTAEYTLPEISSSIHFYWEHRKQRSTLKPVNKPKATQSAFATQGPTLNGEEAPDASVTPESAEATAKTTAEAAKQPKQLTKRKQRKGQNQQRRRTDSNEESSNQPSSNRSRFPKSRTTNNRKHDPCTACGGTSHTFSRCYLVLGLERDWLTDEAQDAFKNNMKAASFKK